MRRVSVANNTSSGSVVTTIVGKRRVSIVNNVVLHSEDVIPEKPKRLSLKELVVVLLQHGNK